MYRDSLLALMVALTILSWSSGQDSRPPGSDVLELPVLETKSGSPPISPPAAATGAKPRAKARRSPLRPGRLPESLKSPQTNAPVSPTPPISAAPPQAEPYQASQLAEAFVLSPAGPRLWGGADYLMWWVRSGGAPPLVVTGSPADAFPGALDQPHTQILFGNHGLDYGMFNGVRATLGTWLDAEGIWGIEASGFVLERRSADFNAQGNANGQPFLAAPFINANTGKDNVYFISQNFPTRPAFLTGAVSVASPTQLWNWEVNGAANVGRTSNGAMTLLAGYRQLSLNENLTYQTAAQNLAAGGAASFLGTALPPGFTVSTFDKFQTQNLFNGGQIGTRIYRRWGAFGLDLVAKVALGTMNEEVIIQGQTTTNAPLPVTTAVGGIYAQASNIGDHNREVFAVVPEANLNFCWYITSSVCARFGYTFLYASNVVRPGEQIDTRLNPNRVPIDAGFGTPGGVNRPILDMRGTGFWAQGLNFGLQFNF